jgi:tetratricopeptide (TPR) repeat protein
MKHTLYVVLIILIFSISGCKQKVNEIANPKYKRAKKLVESGQYEEAIKAFKEYLLVNPKSVKAHLYLADLYYDNADDPLNAIYHYRKVLELDPNSEDKGVITKYLANAESRYYKYLHEKYSIDEDYEGLKKKYDELLVKSKKYYAIAVKLNKFKKAQEQQINELKTELYDAKKQIAVLKKELTKAKTQPVVKTSSRMANKTQVSTATNNNEPKKSFPYYYTIQPGDTLSTISKKHYGTSKYYKKIFRANLSVIKQISRLPVGKKILIPKP